MKEDNLQPIRKQIHAQTNENNKRKQIHKESERNFKIEQYNPMKTSHTDTGKH